MKSKYKCKKGLKKVKIKKYEGGVGELLTDDEGKLTSGAIGAGTALSGVAALGIEGLTKSNVDPKYTSQLKDSSQATGRAIGAGAGQALNLVAPGLGTIASPILSSVGGAVQRGLQGDKLDRIKQETDLKEKVAKANSKIGTDLTSFQAKQYNKGAKKVKSDYKSKASNKVADLEQTVKNKFKLDDVYTKGEDVGFQYPDQLNGSGDTMRHVGTAIHSTNKIKDAAKYLPFGLGTTAGVIGTNLMGIGHEIAQRNPLKNSMSDIYNNAVGSVIGALPVSTKTQEDIADKAHNAGLTHVIGGRRYGKEFPKPSKQSKGNKNVKVIEIEGKKTPEIHTDKNFNLKNLGTTPHYKGGTKVVATEGDVVFPTQNSPEKYNEIMTAIMKKDKYKLKKEQNKLPEDKASKYDEGTKKVKSQGFENLDTAPWLNRFNMGNQALGNAGRTLKNDTKLALTSTGGQFNPFLGNSALANSMKNSKNIAPNQFDKYSPEAKNAFNAKGWLPNGMQLPVEKSKTIKSGGKSSKGSKKAWVNPNAGKAIDSMSTRITKEDTTPIIPSKIDIPTTPVEAATQVAGKVGKKFDANSLLEYAPVAYNLGQGLFGTAEKVNRREYNPQLENYVDTSNNMRREANQNYKMAKQDARNLSGGLASNARANSQVAANQKLAQVNQIDSQEYGKQLDVNNRNIGRTNEAKLTNLGLQNQYDDLDAQNRAVKSNALSTGVEQLGELGSRNKLMKNQLSNQLASAKLLANNYETPIDENGQATGINFNRGNGVSSANYGLFSKAPKKSKGSKSIQVTRKYKLK